MSEYDAEPPAASVLARSPWPRAPLSGDCSFAQPLVTPSTETTPVGAGDCGAIDAALADLESAQRLMAAKDAEILALRAQAAKRDAEITGLSDALEGSRLAAQRQLSAPTPSFLSPAGVTPSTRAVPTTPVSDPALIPAAQIAAAAVAAAAAATTGFLLES